MMAATSTLQSGRLLTATVPNSRRVTLLYNGIGEMARARTETRSGNQWTTQYWEYASFAPDGRALGLIQENTSRTEWEWVWVDNLPVVQFQNSYNSSGTYTGTTVTYLHPDHLGTPRIGTSTAGAISWRYRSDGFGVATISGTHTVRLRLPGQIDLGTGGINYNYFRDYDPQIGRYLESDPIGLDGGLNTYAYVYGNPLRLFDPLGLDAEMCVRPTQGIMIPGQHCFLRYNGDNSDTSTFDLNGVHPDPAPEEARSCTAAEGRDDDECVKREFQKCQNYNFFTNNCCHCAEQALKACGQKVPIPPRQWPNYPFNPGPQAGELGYKP